MTTYDDTDILDGVLLELKEAGNNGLDAEHICKICSWIKAQRKMHEEKW